MKTLCFMFVLGLLMTGPSFNTFASITQDMGISKGKVVHLMDATARQPMRHR